MIEKPAPLRYETLSSPVRNRPLRHIRMAQAEIEAKIWERKLKDIAKIIYDQRVSDGADRDDEELGNEMARAMGCAAKIMERFP